MDEFERLAQNQNPRSARLRLFLFPKGEDSRASSISSLLDGSTNRENWFVDALNHGGARLDRGRSDASSLVSEVPDYLFGLDNSDETQHREPRAKTRPVIHDHISCSDPGSPAPVGSSPFCSTSSAPCISSIPNLPPVKTKPDSPVPVVDPKENQAKVDSFQAEITEQPQQNLYTGNQVLHYTPDSTYSGHSVQPVPVYYVPGPVQPGKVPVQAVPMPAPYVQHYPAVPGQVPIGYHHVYPGMDQTHGGRMRPMAAMHPYDASARVVADGLRQQVYHGIPNSGAVPAYPVMAVSGREESQTAHRDGSGHQYSK